MVCAAFYENIAPNGKNGHINSRKNAVEGGAGAGLAVRVARTGVDNNGSPSK